MAEARRSRWLRPSWRSGHFSRPRAAARDTWIKFILLFIVHFLLVFQRGARRAGSHHLTTLGTTDRASGSRNLTTCPSLSSFDRQRSHRRHRMHRIDATLSFSAVSKWSNARARLRRCWTTWPRGPLDPQDQRSPFPSVPFHNDRSIHKKYPIYVFSIESRKGQGIRVHFVPLVVPPSSNIRVISNLLWYTHVCVVFYLDDDRHWRLLAPGRDDRLLSSISPFPFIFPLLFSAISAFISLLVI